MNKVNEGGSYDDIDKIVTDYYHLIKTVHEREKLKLIEIMKDNYYVVLLDGIEYDFNMLILHDDEQNTEGKMEIATLLTDPTFLSLI